MPGGNVLIRVLKQWKVDGWDGAFAPTRAAADKLLKSFEPIINTPYWCAHLACLLPCNAALALALARALPPTLTLALTLTLTLVLNPTR